jgi:hypothetical protein
MKHRVLLDVTAEGDAEEVLLMGLTYLTPLEKDDDF